MCIIIILITIVIYIRTDPYLDICKDGIFLWYNTLIEHKRKFLKLK